MIDTIPTNEEISAFLIKDFITNPLTWKGQVEMQGERVACWLDSTRLKETILRTDVNNPPRIFIISAPGVRNFRFEVDESTYAEVISSAQTLITEKQQKMELDVVKKEQELALFHQEVKKALETSS